MSDDGSNHDRQENGNRRPARPESVWVERYAAKHSWQRLTDFPVGLQPPVKVRIYRRTNHFILQWWDPGAKRNLAERIDGDLLSALIAARKIDERLANQHTAGTGRRRLDHAELVHRYVEDLHKRADAGSLSPASTRRFISALRHYLEFIADPMVARNYPYAVNINRDFRLTFDAYLTNRQIHSNGHPRTPLRLMKGQPFITDAVRAMLEWAADPERGNLLPDTFRNPFRRPKESRALFRGDPLSEPAITLPMTVAFVEACDRFQLCLFVPLIVFGLRAAEPCMLFREHLDSNWLRVGCIPELAYLTKGKRDKRLPLIEALLPFWNLLRETTAHGLLYQRRSVIENREHVLFCPASLADLIQEFRSRCSRSKALTSTERINLRSQLLGEAGGLKYDHIEQEFHKVARRLTWPCQATLKDFRHAFATMLGNTPMAEAYKKYLMGQSPGKTALNAYTHINQLRVQFQASVNHVWSVLIEAIQRRVQEV